MKIIWNLFVILFFMISSCGDQLKTKTKDESINVTTELLIGTWTSECNNSNDETTSNKTSIIFSSNGDNLTATTKNYSDTNCSNESFIFKKVLNNFVLGDKTTTEQNQIIYKFTANIFSITLEPKTSLVSSSLNFNNYCGLAGWANDNATSLVGLTCNSKTYKSFNDVHNDIVQMNSEKTFIRLGNINNTSNTDGYPKTLFAEEYFH